MPVSDDGPLPLALRRLADAVHALVDRQPVWVGGVCRWEDSLYVRLRGALRGSRAAPARRRGPGSRLPCNTAVLALLPPVVVVVLMQRWFVAGLTEGEK